MAKPKDDDAERQEAEARLAEANEQLEKARAEAAEAQQGLAAAVTRAVPEMEVEVLPNNVASHNGKDYYEGDSFSVEGPTALALMQGGHVTIKGAK